MLSNLRSTKKEDEKESAEEKKEKRRVLQMSIKHLELDANYSKEGLHNMASYQSLSSCLGKVPKHIHTCISYTISFACFNNFQISFAQSRKIQPSSFKNICNFAIYVQDISLIPLILPPKTQCYDRLTANGPQFPTHIFA